MKLDQVLLIMLIIGGAAFLLYMLNKKPTTTAVIGAAPVTNDVQLANRLLLGLGTPRITPKRIVTVTGTVVGVKPHFAPDGDLVFAFKPDPPNDVLVNAQNKAQSKMAGGLWCEGMCQQGIKTLPASQPWHKGDCVRGGPFPKFPTPNVGERWSVTGMYAIDHREGGHAEIHPITRMSRL